jgi:hypothetical protein
MWDDLSAEVLEEFESCQQSLDDAHAVGCIVRRERERRRKREPFERAAAARRQRERLRRIYAERGDAWRKYTAYQRTAQERKRRARGVMPAAPRPQARCHPEMLHEARGRCEACYRRDLRHAQIRAKQAVTTLLQRRRRCARCSADLDLSSRITVCAECIRRLH